jgi:hypothetical protein
MLPAMATLDSLLDADAMAEARALLAPAAPRERLWPVIGAALCLTAASLGFAVAMVLAPPVVREHTAKGAP